MIICVNMEVVTLVDLLVTLAPWGGDTATGETGPRKYIHV